MRRFARFAALFAVLLAACGDASSPGDMGADAAADAGVPPVTCAPGTPWAPGAPAFVDRTTAWGLDGVMGSSLTTGDLDGDGFADLIAVSPGTMRGIAHVYFNRPAPGGGRTFVDATHESGLTATRDGMEGRYFSYATLGDVDDDGDLDVYTEAFYYDAGARMGLTDTSELLLNDGHGHFTLTPDSAVAPFENPDVPRSGSMLFLDSDRDGHLDLFDDFWYAGAEPFLAPYGQRPILLAGDGTGAFTDVTADRGITFVNTDMGIRDGTNGVPFFGATACDVNGDGRSDLLLAAYGRLWNHGLYSDGANQYVERGRATGVAGDDRVDYSDDQSYRCYCQATPGTCPAGVPAPQPGFCTAFGGTLGRGWQPGETDQPFMLNGNTFSFSCGDVDNDGDMDLYSSEIRHPDVGSASDPSELLINDGSGTFTRPGRDAMGLTPPIDLASVDEGGQNGGLFDFDDDGWLDVYLGGSPYPHNRGWLFHQVPPAPGTPWTGHFEYVTPASGFDHPCATGIALADFDHDGDQDLVVGTYGCGDDFGGGTSPPAPYVFYENVSAQNDWLEVHLVGGAGTARQALGARVRVTAGGVTRTRELFGSWGRAAESQDPVVHVGLGASCTIDSVEVRWPDAAGTTESWTSVVANHRVELRQGDAAVHYLE